MQYKKNLRHIESFWDYFLSFGRRSPGPFQPHPRLKKTLFNILVTNNGQTWANDHLRKATTCLQRSLIWGSNYNIYIIKLLLNNDHLSTTVTILGSRGWSSLTVLFRKVISYLFWALFNQWIVTIGGIY